MPLIKTIRPSDSPHVLSVTRYFSDTDSFDVAVPDGSWDLVLMKREGGKADMLLTGQTTQAVRIEFSPGDEFISISFKASSYLSQVAAHLMVDQGRVLDSAGGKRFMIGADSLEVPSFENAEALVNRLIRNGLLETDDIVDGLLYGKEMAASIRSVQRHFLHATGMTQKDFQQIERANRAIRLLSGGRPAVDVAFELGYSDQAHLTRSIKRFTGRTPREISGGVHSPG